MEYEKLDDLKLIKKEYGEKLAHLCRELFPTILEKPGALYHVLSSNFAKSKDLYDDIIAEHKEYLFKEYLYHFFDLDKEKENKSTKSVKELLDEAGYNLYECKTNEDIQKFRKYYSSKEELCTFRDPHRIDNHHIFFIVKKNVDEIKRENFTNPKREDEYGISVLDLQFDKGNKQRVSIKSRYNHTVNNPDATYSNNLENIAVGLTDAFEKDYGFNIGSESELGFELDHYVKARDGKFYKYNYEIYNIHYCPNNIIIDNGNVIDTYSDKSKYIIIDYFIIDLSQKKIFTYDGIKDSFLDIHNNIKNITITKTIDSKQIELTLEDNQKAIITIDKDNRIIGYENKTIEEIGRSFLSDNECLKKLILPKLKICDDYFLSFNREIEEVYLPCLKICGDYFLAENKRLIELDLSNIQEHGEFFFYKHELFKNLSVQKLNGNKVVVRDDQLEFIPINSETNSIGRR